MQLFTTVFLSVLLTLVKSRAVHADEYHYVKCLKAKVDDVFGKLEILENLIKQQNEIIDSQNKRITVLEDIVLQQTSRFNREVTSQQKKVKGYYRRMHLRNTQEDDILHEKKRKEDYPKDICSMLKISNAIKELNKASIGTKMVDIDSKEKNAFSATTVERRFDTKEGKHSGSDIKTYSRRRSTTASPWRIAFTAYLDRTASHLGIDQPIPFNKVLLNDGNTFNNFTGMFHCPVTGVYLFTFHIESNRMGEIVAKLAIDGANQIDAIATADSHSFVMGGNTAVVRVAAGQTVWVATYEMNDATLVNDDNLRYTSFSGVLLY